VVAAEDVRSAVRVSRTAANAKAAAVSALFSAQTACETGDFATIDEARAAQTRASIAQSHAIHAAVVDHEAKTVKRRATLALAHDVKCWNVHRKREMLRACLDNARSQHEATRRAVDAWSCLRDGFIGATLIPPTQERRNSSTPVETNTESRQRRVITEPDEVTATIYEEIIPSSLDGEPLIVAVNHRALVYVPEDAEASLFKPTTSMDLMDADLILPFATAAPIPEEDEDFFNNQDESTGSSYLDAKPDAKPDVSSSEDLLSASMQSLVDGLMNWGGGFDAEEDHFALPAGMAASIALEESGALGATKIA
jgi:cellobiose-specific phosphotransferase system component IIA